MRLAWLELKDFRNHADTRLVDVPEGLIVAVGANGEGKTNLLEGVHVLYAVGSPRASSAEPLVRRGAESAYVRGEVESTDGRVLIEIELRVKGASKIHVNRSPVRRRRDLRSKVRVVLFGPFDLHVVTGDPSRRRGFLDEVVVARHPAHDTLTSTYERVLRQRNRLLKEHEGRGAPSGLEAWDEQLVETGSAVVRARAEAAGSLAEPANDAFASIAGYGLDVEYDANVDARGDVESAFRQALAARRDDELLRRTSLVGPHRDDLALAVRDLGARAFGSHGETWAAALCLRLALATEVKARIGEPPILLVDDPFSALDPSRRDRLSAHLAGRGGQVVISVADEADVPSEATEVWDVRAGSVRPRSEVA